MEARHVSAVAALAHSLENDPATARMDERVHTGTRQRLHSRRKLMLSNRFAARAAKTAAAVVSVFATTAGLALAGVTCPTPSPSSG